MGHARAWALEVEAGRLLTAKQSPPLRDVLLRYAEEVSPSRRGFKWELLRLRKWRTETWTAQGIAGVTPEAIGRWRDARLKTVSAGTVIRELTLLGSVFEAARREWRYIQTNPVRDVRRPPAPQDRRRRVSDAEIDLLIHSLDYARGDKPVTTTQRVGAMVLFAVETGMRSGELCRIRWTDCHGDYITLPASMTKTARSRDVPLTPAAKALLKLLPHDDETIFNVSDASRDALFRKGRDRSGIEGLHFHDLRAEAVWRLSRKLPLLALARAIGHSDIASLGMYYQTTGQELAAMLEDKP